MALLCASTSSEQMATCDRVVIGASAGGVTALMNLVKGLPDDFNAAVFVVQHVSPTTPSVLPQILARSGPLPATHAVNGESIKERHIYVAPPDHHLLLEDGQIMVTKGPKENRFRPSIDALFRSAAYEYGPRVTGIILSGLLDDGTAGLWSIKRLGGTAIIQDPAEAEFPSMPRSVMEYVDVDHVLPAAEMGAVLHRLCCREAAEPVPLIPAEEERWLKEINIAAQKNAMDMGVLELGKPSLLTCPECSGALMELREGKLVRYRCHTGHGFTSSALLSGVTKSVEENLWQVVRGLEEAYMILEQSAKQYKEAGNEKDAKKFAAKAEQIRARSRAIQQLIGQQEQLSEELRFGGNGE